MTVEDEKRKAMFANIKKSNPIRTESRKKCKRLGEEKDAQTGKAPSKSKKPSSEISRAQIIPQDDNLYKSFISAGISAGTKALTVLSTSIFGVPISTTVTNATFNSIEDSYKFYKETNNIDDALFIGMKSFVYNYTNNSIIEYSQDNLHKKNDDDIFDDVLEGAILLSSIVVDSFF